MKALKTTLILAFILCLTCNLSQAQQMFLVHQDNVKPSKMMEYEKIAKEFHAASVEHNLQTKWVTAVSNDFRYFYITPIENFAELDKRPMADMAKAMGDKFGEMFERYDKCYNSHGSYIVVHDEELSYMPNGSKEAIEGKNYRKWFYMYYAPKNAKKVKEGMKAVKELFASKGSTNYYRIYRNGFGAMENYYLVSVAAKDEIDGATQAKANEDVLGPDRWETFSKVLNNISRMEEYSGEMRPDLSYSPK
ncbi:hypothetical protein Q4Q34_16580 [Flavivirga abyssicola]|uniref:hypothetical protein n=1 Tax=Flavivirga abyssicola TaxID=3063533 RepID=UPI0026DFD776|nr:hypothetical protein [Flavivirga sp. MEBiC07777]WVK12833.1 hypothetical protein Q4Q34_16580 [Flavivirga sp. MEBiC07777]